jgi:hypothetical protein
MWNLTILFKTGQSRTFSFVEYTNLLQHLQVLDETTVVSYHVQKKSLWK